MHSLDFDRLNYNDSRISDVHAEVRKRIFRISNSILELQRDIVNVRNRETRLQMKLHAQEIIHQLDNMEFCENEIKHFDLDNKEIMSSVLKLKPKKLMASKNRG